MKITDVLERCSNLATTLVINPQWATKSNKFQLKMCLLSNYESLSAICDSATLIKNQIKNEFQFTLSMRVKLTIIETLIKEV